MSNYFIIETNHLTVWKKINTTFILKASLSEICERDRILKSYLLYFLEENSLAKSVMRGDIRIFEVEKDLAEIIIDLISLRYDYLSATEITSFLRDVGFFSCMEKKDYATLKKNLKTYKTFSKIVGRKKNERVPIL